MLRVVLCVTAALVLVAPAAAHGPSGVKSGYVSSVSEIRPNVLGLQATVLGGDDRLVVTNWSGKTVVILGRSGRPLVRLDGRFVARRIAGSWQRVRAGTSFGWHDHRIGWFGAEPPPVVARDPGSSHYIREWRIPGTADGRPFVIRGLLGYAPPPGAGGSSSAWPLRAAALAVLAAVVGALVGFGARRRRQGSRPGPDARPAPASQDRSTE